MKFQLKPRNQLITDVELLDDLRRAAGLNGSSTLTKSGYERHGRYYRGTIAARFGSWEAALERAGLIPQRATAREDLIADLQRVSQELGRNYISFKEYRRLGRWSERPYVRVFGDWRTALAAAGLQRHPNLKDRVGDVDLFENLEAVWVTLGRQPRYSEMERPLSRFSASTYSNRFGGWLRALEQFVGWINRERMTSSRRPTRSPTPRLSWPLRQSPKHRAPYERAKPPVRSIFGCGFSLCSATTSPAGIAAARLR